MRRNKWLLAAPLALEATPATPSDAGGSDSASSGPSAADPATLARRPPSS